MYCSAVLVCEMQFTGHNLVFHPKQLYTGSILTLMTMSVATAGIIGEINDNNTQATNNSKSTVLSGCGVHDIVHIFIIHLLFFLI